LPFQPTGATEQRLAGAHFWRAPRAFGMI